MKASKFSPTTPPSSPIKVNILHYQYAIKPTNHLTEADIRRLAEYVDGVMRQASQKAHDPLKVAIMAALNIAAQMHEEQQQYADSIRQLVQMMDEAMGDKGSPDTQCAAPTVDVEHSI